MLTPGNVDNAARCSRCPEKPCCPLFTEGKYTRAKTLTPRMLNERIDHIEVHQAEKIDGIWEQHLGIHYNCVGAIFIPDVFPLPAPQVNSLYEKSECS